MSIPELLENAQTSATRAVQFDQSGQFNVASFYYQDAARSLYHAAHAVDSEETAQKWREKMVEYQNRSEEIHKLLGEARQPIKQSDDLYQLQRCSFLLNQALDADEAGLKDEAIELYKQAVEHSIEAKSKSTDPEQQQKLHALASQALDRAETLKGIVSPERCVQPGPSLPSPSHVTSVQRVPSESGQNIEPKDAIPTDIRPPLHRGSSAHLKVVGGSGSYTDEEKRVLLATSRINDIDYVPFMSVDLKEKFQYAIPFTDRDGPLKLSPKQQREFHRWARPQEFSSEPKMVVGSQVDPYSIKQTIISDCSFVASLAISARYERRFGKPLITSIIYPRNRRKEPVYNPFGKYMVKLHLNGVPRKVIIDDTLPVGRHGELLCSYSTNSNELWISLLEKAYMKVMGGYDFPGSNSNIDLHALTGWIPERYAIRVNEADFNSDTLFEMLLNRMAKGDVLATVATGDIREEEADRAGLVPSHAYAVLDVRKVNGVRLMKLKNPWSHLRWRGNYSELDTAHWTPKMREALNFDPNSASMFDNGVFWIDYESILRFYDVFYLNWNPQMFQYTYCVHQSWRAGAGPIKDVYNIGENPQFHLEVGPGSGAVWILLSRHITEIEDFKENREYITVLVYNTGGRKVYYPHDPPPYIDGVRINSPHYLCKLKLNDASPRKYTLVVSQYEKMNTIHYTLRAYATCPFKLEPISNPYSITKQVSNEWKNETAGGCINYPQSYPKNPRYQLVLDSPRNSNKVLFDLRGPKQYQIGLDVQVVVLNDSSATFKKTNSGNWRSGFVALEINDMPAGTYEVIPSTFYPGQEGPFILAVKSSCPITLARLQ